MSSAAALRRSSLEQAFTGKLVPQDPSDEPASALVERIRAEREVTVPALPRRRVRSCRWPKRPFRPTEARSTIAYRGKDTVKASKDDIRFDVPLYTAAEAARFLGVPTSTFSTWAKGYVRRPPLRPAVLGAAVVTSMEAPRNFPTIPFVGLAEGMVIAAFRRAGVSLQHIRKAVSVLEREIGVEHALASRRLYTDGAVILYDYAEREEERLAGLTEVVSRQQVFSPVVEAYLTRIEYGTDDWAVRLASPVTRRPVVIVDPQRSFGQPIFARSAAPVENVISRLKAGESIAAVARDFGVPAGDVEDYLCAAVPLAA